MTETLRDELLLYLGELQYDYENSNHYFKKLNIESKIKTINELLKG